MLVGFLTGVGLQVGIAMLGDMLGVAMNSQRTVGQLWQVIQSLGEVHLPTLAISAVVVAGILVSRHFLPQLPFPLFVVVGAITASFAWDFAARGIAVVGPVPGGLPPFGFPSVSWPELLKLLPIAASCFVMIIAQSAAASRVFAARYQERVDENADILGLSAANAAAAVSGTFVNGSPTQTAMAALAGARSQFAQLVFAGVVAIVLLFLAGPLQYLPRCLLGGIVFTIAIGLIDLRSLRDIYRESPGEFTLAVIMAAVVALVGVEQGILLAMALSLLRTRTPLRRGGTRRFAPLPATSGLPELNGHRQTGPVGPFRALVDTRDSCTAGNRHYYSITSLADGEGSGKIETTARRLVDAEFGSHKFAWQAVRTSQDRAVPLR